MADYIQREWIAPNIIRLLDPDEANPRRKPPPDPTVTSDGDLAFQFNLNEPAQIIKFTSLEEPITAELSDKTSIITAVFSSSCRAAFEQQHSRDLPTAIGAIIDLKSVRVLFRGCDGELFRRSIGYGGQVDEPGSDKHRPPAESLGVTENDEWGSPPIPEIYIEIEEFGHCGSDKKPIFGQPRPLIGNTKVMELLRRLPKRVRHDDVPLSKARSDSQSGPEHSIGKIQDGNASKLSDSSDDDSDISFKSQRQPEDSDEDPPEFATQAPPRRYPVMRKLDNLSSPVRPEKDIRLHKKNIRHKVRMSSQPAVLEQAQSTPSEFTTSQAASLADSTCFSEPPPKTSPPVSQVVGGVGTLTKRAATPEHNNQKNRGISASSSRNGRTVISPSSALAKPPASIKITVEISRKARYKDYEDLEFDGLRETTRPNSQKLLTQSEHCSANSKKKIPDSQVTSVRKCSRCDPAVVFDTQVELKAHQRLVHRQSVRLTYRDGVVVVVQRKPDGVFYCRCGYSNVDPKIIKQHADEHPRHGDIHKHSKLPRRVSFGTGWDNTTQVSQIEAEIPKWQQEVLSRPEAWYPPIPGLARTGCSSADKVQHIPTSHSPPSPTKYRMYVPQVEVPRRDTSVTYTQTQDSLLSDDEPFSWPESSPIAPKRHTKGFNAILPDSSANSQSQTNKGRIVTRGSHGIVKRRMPLPQKVAKPRAARKVAKYRKKLARPPDSSGEEFRVDFNVRESSVEPPVPMINPEGFTRAQKYGILGSQKVNEWRRKRREAKRRAENGEKSSESEAEVEYEDNEPASSDTQESDVGETSNGSTVAVDMQRHPIKRESYLLSDGDGARAAGIEDMGSRKDLETHENREQLIAQAVVTGIPQIPQNPESRPDASTMSIKTEPTDPSETLAPVAMIGSEYAARANSSSIDEEYDIPVAPLVPLSTQIGRRQTTSIILQGVQLLTNIFVSGRNSIISSSTPRVPRKQTPSAAANMAEVQVAETPYKGARTIHGVPATQGEYLEYTGGSGSCEMPGNGTNERVSETQQQPGSSEPGSSSSREHILGNTNDSPTVSSDSSGSEAEAPRRVTLQVNRTPEKGDKPRPEILKGRIKKRRIKKSANFASQEIREVQHDLSKRLAEQAKQYFSMPANSDTPTEPKDTPSRKRPQPLALTAPKPAKAPRIDEGPRSTTSRCLGAILNESPSCHTSPPTTSPHGSPVLLSAKSLAGSESITLESEDSEDVIPARPGAASPSQPAALWRPRFVLSRERTPSVECTSDSVAPENAVAQQNATHLMSHEGKARSLSPTYTVSEDEVTQESVTSDEPEPEPELYAGLRRRVIKVPGYENLSMEQKQLLDERRKEFFGSSRPSGLFRSDSQRWSRRNKAEPLRKLREISRVGGGNDAWYREGYREDNTPLKTFVKKYRNLKQVRHELNICSGASGP